MGGGCNKHASVRPVRDLYSLLSQLADLESLTRTRLARQPVWGSAGDSSGATTLQGAHWVIQQFLLFRRFENFLYFSISCLSHKKVQILIMLGGETLCKHLFYGIQLPLFPNFWQIVMWSCRLFIWLLYSSSNMYRDKSESAPLWPALALFCAPKKHRTQKSFL